MNSQDDERLLALSPFDLIQMNGEVLGEEGHVRDVGLLFSAARRPFLSFFGQAQFPTLLDKAAALLHSLAYHHLFMDGNKRTASLAVTRFLAWNGYQPTWDEEAWRGFILEIAQGQHEPEAIAAWLAGHTRGA